MKVFIKENPALDRHLVHSILKRDVSVQRLLTPNVDKISASDVIILSKKDILFFEKEKYNYNIIFIEDILGKINENILQEISINYDYYYLKYQLSRGGNASTVITGSSYGLFGIEEELFNNAINLSLSSQDLYYSIKAINCVWTKNKNIKQIILCVSYYFFYDDLSRTNEIQRISKVYSPIFDDRHNCYLMPPKENILYKSDIFDIENILNSTVNKIYSDGYFNKYVPRCNLAMKIWNNDKIWADCTYEEKIAAGKERAISHNKSLKHVNTLLDNVKLFAAWVEFCKHNDISLTLALPPTSKYYNKYLSPQFKDIFYEVVRSVGNNLKVLDYSADSNFVDEDFNDMDHLSEIGAIKFTKKILKMI